LQESHDGFKLLWDDIVYHGISIYGMCGKPHGCFNGLGAGKIYRKTGKPLFFHGKIDGKSMVSGFDFPLNPSIDCYYCEGQFAEP
jgi:hypothetical protein